MCTITLTRDPVRVVHGQQGVAGRCRATRGHRVDEKLTERRDGKSLNGIQRTQETGADMRFLEIEPVTSGFERRSALLDAEEVRGSNPLAPTTKDLLTGPFLMTGAELIGGSGLGNRRGLPRRAGDVLR